MVSVVSFLSRKSAGSYEKWTMSDLSICPVFEEISSDMAGESFSVGHSGRYCRKNVLILQYDPVTLMLVFGEEYYSFSRPEFVKSVSLRGNAARGIQIVGNKNVILLLDDSGALWKLINAFETSDEQEGQLSSLNDSCFYEWIPYKKFNFEKVLAVSAWRHGFMCIGISRNSERKLLLLPFADSSVFEDYIFEEIRYSSSFSFYLKNIRLNTEDLLNPNIEESEEKLLVTERLSGKTYICSESEKNLINCSSDCLVAAFHLEQENCLLLCFESGKLVCHFLNSALPESVCYLPKKLSLIEKCCCLSCCVLWSDGITFHHSQLVFQQHSAQLVHLKLQCNVVKPIWLTSFINSIIAVSVNNIYYVIRASSTVGKKIHKQPEELLSIIYKGSLEQQELNRKIDAITHFLSWKEIIHGNDFRERVEISMEQNHVLIKLCSSVTLKKDFWKVKLVTSLSGKKWVKIATFETDMSEGMVIRIENPFKTRVKVTLVGDFNCFGENLFAYLGEVGGSENEISDLTKTLKLILNQKNDLHP